MGRRYVGETSTAVDFQVLVVWKIRLLYENPRYSVMSAAINKTENLLRVTGVVGILGRI
jgi:hypothetical protein